MNITELNQDQTRVVAGGYYRQQQGIQQEIHHIIGVLTERFQEFKNSELERCVSTSNTTYGVTLCLPTRKPLQCSYELWGMLHDLSEEMPKC